MTSTERVLEYRSLEQERPLQTSANQKPCTSWPEKGVIRFEKVSFSYNNRDKVLNNISFEIQDREKVGFYIFTLGEVKESIFLAGWNRGSHRSWQVVIGASIAPVCRATRTYLHWWRQHRNTGSSWRQRLYVDDPTRSDTVQWNHPIKYRSFQPTQWHCFVVGNWRGNLR